VKQPGGLARSGGDPIRAAPQENPLPFTETSPLRTLWTESATPREREGRSAARSPGSRVPPSVPGDTRSVRRSGQRGAVVSGQRPVDMDFEAPPKEHYRCRVTTFGSCRTGEQETLRPPDRPQSCRGCTPVARGEARHFGHLDGEERETDPDSRGETDAGRQHVASPCVHSVVETGVDPVTPRFSVASGWT